MLGVSTCPLKSAPCFLQRRYVISTTDKCLDSVRLFHPPHTLTTIPPTPHTYSSHIRNTSYITTASSTVGGRRERKGWRRVEEGALVLQTVYPSSCLQCKPPARTTLSWRMAFHQFPHETCPFHVWSRCRQGAISACVAQLIRSGNVGTGMYNKILLLHFATWFSTSWCLAWSSSHPTFFY